MMVSHLTMQLSKQDDGRLSTYFQSPVFLVCSHFFWGCFVSFSLVNFFAKIVTSTAQNYLKKQQELELKKKKMSSSKHNGSFKANGIISTY